MPITSPQTPRSLLLATDLGARCDRALERALDLARHWQARLVVVSVLPPLEQHELSEELFGQADWGPSLDPLQYAQRRLHRDLGERASGVDVVLRLEQGAVGPAIARVAQETGCGLVITGLARDAIFEQPRLGSTVTWLARHSEVPVLLVRNRAHQPYRSIVLANDHSAHCQHALHTALALFGEPLQLSLVHALERALDLARRWQAQLVVVSVLPPLEQHELSEELFGQADWGPSLGPLQYAQRRLQRDLGELAAGVEVSLRLEQGLSLIHI